MSDIPENTDQEHIDKIIEDLVSAKTKEAEDYFRGSYGELFEDQEKHTDYQHEILAKVVFQVLSVNEKGQSVKTSKVVEKNFYIPLPVKEDYDRFIGIFDDHLQKSMAKASKEIFDKKQ
jgi:hypothetical protein